MRRITLYITLICIALTTIANFCLFFFLSHRFVSLIAGTVSLVCFFFLWYADYRLRRELAYLDHLKYMRDLVYMQDLEMYDDRDISRGYVPPTDMTHGPS